MIEFFLVFAFFLLCYTLIKNIGKTFPLFELTAVLYLLQYGIAPMLEYKFGELGSMSVPIDEYLPFGTFASLSFITGLFVFTPKLSLKPLKINPEIASRLGRVFLTIGLLSSFAMLILPDSLRSIVTFFIILKWPGVFSLIFSQKKIDKFLVVIVFLEIAISAILNALLIEFIVFSIFMLMYISLRYTISNKIKITMALSAMLFLTVYQGIKAEYRKVVWENEVSFIDKIGLLSELISFNSFSAAFNIDIGNNDSLLQTIHRLNQGWQTSMVMNHVPTNVKFEDGSALLEDVTSSIMPRFLYPNKRVVNDYKRFNYYTGYNLNSGTAMTIGVLGDIYINFGFFGSFFCLFILGAFFSRISLWFYKQFVYSNPINIIWLPFIFSYLIRPGNEFYMVLNHLFKALIVFFVVKKIVYPYLIKNLKPKLVV
ncbi:hypothetical protein EHW67_16020 [Arenibacter aquaticus]|uniref:Oligosaccharide repeat unit polymerase n=1 Tax=Arenibacter aquaticus TaxID=2489054 RepID=A0A3S0IJM6_9FLAO|nr:hypothetical protein [Arenibacter aquaticus]RTE51717.1 hypothetical protein EHW67_16020 [Arenibacter aquaticus]